MSDSMVIQSDLTESLLPTPITDGLPCRTRPSLLERLTPTLRILQTTGYFPSRVGYKFCSLNLWGFLLICVPILGISVNGYLCFYTVQVGFEYNSIFGILHASTISSIITGIKPLINFASIGIFLLMIRKHRKLLVKLDKAEYGFYWNFGKSPNIERMNKFMFAATLASFFVPLSVRIVEFRILDENFGESIMSDLSLVLVPFLTVWNLIPLLYYHMINAIIRYWAQLIKRRIKMERRMRKYDLKFYYQQFLQLTDIQESTGKVFNPFILFSLGWSLFSLCLTIYFATQAGASMDDPPGQIKTKDDKILWYKTVHFNMLWSGVQILVALLYMATICATGTNTNEKLAYFVHKTNTQYMWGMSVWRAFPLERSTFFTIMSIVVTYAFLLLKLKDFKTFDEYGIAAQNVSNLILRLFGSIAIMGGGCGMKGARRQKWWRNCSIWRHFRDYFPAKLHKTVELDPERNYIMGVHPHGVLAVGAFVNFGTDATGFSEKFSGITPHPMTLVGQFWFPIRRELILLLGGVEVSKNSISYLMNLPTKGHAVIIVVGGAMEVLDAKPGTNCTNLSNRKGFIKQALIHGADLVPIFSFGENDLYNQMKNDRGSGIRKFQSSLKRYMGVPLSFFYGRGIFNYSFGLLPFRRPVNTVVGRPIRVEKVPNPTSEQVVELHGKYCNTLNELFEENKKQFGLSDENKLIIN